MPPRKSQRTVGERSPFAACVQEAETLQQRAERRRGAEAVAVYERAAAKFQAAVQLADGEASQEDVAEVFFGLVGLMLDQFLSSALMGMGECLQNWGETVLDVCRTSPDAILVPANEEQAQAQAAQLFERAIQAYKQVPAAAAAAGMRVDAAVNCGNTLAAMAELLAGRPGQAEAAGRALVEAERAYQAALQQEDDALTWSNLGDVVVQHAELCCQMSAAHPQAGSEAQALYSQAREAYSRACALSSSENGDDLPGLLLNWGVALLSMAKHAQDPALAVELLGEAAQRLSHSISFDRGDVAPHNALGDVLLAKAERVADASPDTAVAAAISALDDGFSAALRINASCPEALVGKAEAHVQVARLSGGGEEGARHWGEAAQAYQVALQTPDALGSFQDRCDVRYNYACCLAQCGQVGEAKALVGKLVEAGAVTQAEVDQDGDLSVLRVI